WVDLRDRTRRTGGARGPGCKSHFAREAWFGMMVEGILRRLESSRQEAGESRRPGMERSERLRRKIEEFVEQLTEEFGNVSAGENGCLLEAVEDWAVEVGDQ